MISCGTLFSYEKVIYFFQKGVRGMFYCPFHYFDKREFYRLLSTRRTKGKKKLQGYLSSAIEWITAVWESVNCIFCVEKQRKGGYKRNENREHIDEDRANQNIYWDCYTDFFLQK